MSDKDQPKICSICGIEYTGYGNNAWPVNTGRCCDMCDSIVIAARIRQVQRGKHAYGHPDWYKELLTKTSEQLVKNQPTK